MSLTLGQEVAQADGLDPEDATTVAKLVGTWKEHYARNCLRDRYYRGHVRVKDLGVSVHKQLARKLDPRVDWAAKCVDFWADRVQYDGVALSGAGDDSETQQELDSILAENGMKQLVHLTATASLRHSCAFIGVTLGDTEKGEDPVVISAYPATAASAIWSKPLRRIVAGMVVVDTERMPHSSVRRPKTVDIYTDAAIITLTHDPAGWHAEYHEHSMGRAPMVHVAYHPTLDNPFGRSRITRSVMNYVDDAQRELMNMTVAAAFAAAPQKYLMNASKGAAEAIKGSPFEAYIGSIFAATSGRDGQTPQFGQLSQGSMQPHVDYMRSLASQFSGSTGVPLSSLGVVSDNPSSAEAIYASKEDAVVDIQHYIDGWKRALQEVCRMAWAAYRDEPYRQAAQELGTVIVNFKSPSMPSIVSQSDAMVKQISAIPWLADSDVALQQLGYDDEQIAQLRSDRRKSQALAGAQAILDRNRQVIPGADNAGGAGPVPAAAGQAAV